MRTVDAGSILPVGGGNKVNKTNQPVDNRVYICSICGKPIAGEHVEIRTRRNTKLHIHYGCVPRGSGNGNEKEQ